MTAVLRRTGKCQGRLRHREHHVTMKGELEMQLQAKGWQKIGGHHQNPGEGRARLHAESQRGITFLLTLIPDFQPPELQRKENLLLFVQPFFVFPMWPCEVTMVPLRLCRVPGNYWFWIVSQVTSWPLTIKLFFSRLITGRYPFSQRKHFLPPCLIRVMRLVLINRIPNYDNNQSD